MGPTAIITITMRCGYALRLLCFRFSVRISPCRLCFCFFRLSFCFFSLLFFRLTFYVCELVLGLGYDSVRLALGYVRISVKLALGLGLA